jgi:hypothetical protein
MNEFVVDDSFAELLRTAVEPVTIVDSSGRQVGYFAPHIDPADYKNYEIPEFTEEELSEAEMEEGRPLAQILADLERLK